jgi:DNA helicase-2/ATP-dependent DNA helicase PcrA
LDKELSRLESLNSVQRDAILHTDGPVLVVAGAGSGKTRVLTHRVAHLLEQLKIRPWEILAVTFTNKAAQEMKERILDLTQGIGSEAWIGTFHSISARILRVEAELLGYERNFSIFDREDQVRFIRSVMGELNISTKEYSPEAVLSRISGAKNNFVSPREYQSVAVEPIEHTAAMVYTLYQKLLKRNNSMDFDDLLVNPILLWERNQSVLEKYQNRFRYLLVDEFQDTNRTQYLLLKMLSAKHKNLCVVGDDDQSIYRWRGADIQNILNLETDYPNCKVFRLEQNYRSTQHILNTAHSVIRNNVGRREKTLWTEKELGEKVQVMEVEDGYGEAHTVVDLIRDEVSRKGRDFADFAVLYRTNAQSRLIEDSLRMKGIPYLVVGGVKFYERREIKDVLAYLRLICNHKDNISFKRVINYPLRGIGETSITKIAEFATENEISMFEAAVRIEEIASITPRIQGNIAEFCALVNKYASLRIELSASELTQALVDEIAILRAFKEIGTAEAQMRAENVRELLSAIAMFARANQDASLDNFLEGVALVTDIDIWDDKSNSVTLMTLHSAKGLEFPVVFLTGLEEGLFPLSRSFMDEEELEEERRLFYVGATRAKGKLCLSWAANRMIYGESRRNLPSRFLSEIDDDFVIRNNLRRSTTTYRDKKLAPSPDADIMPSYEDFSQEVSVLSVGCEVTHDLFGHGRILAAQGHGEDMKVTVKFYDAGVKKLVVKYANLQILV